ncbi:MAG: hypothetical protein KDJ16_15775 [Hyphomicrobiales bacterium]|nr:hypothetical protein [Hyphomicrobiales bacterium]
MGLRLQTIKYECGNNPPEVLEDMPAPDYPAHELLDTAKFFFFMMRGQGSPLEAVRFLDEDGSEIVRFGAREEAEG